jgi:zinc D-Ala-D-Ala carboxypeptidase
MNLTKHFTLEELVNSETATRLGIDNTPTVEVIDNLTFLAEKLEDVRALLCNPMLVSSGYRSLILNRHLGSRDTSSHAKGLAIDFISPSFGNPEAIVKAIVESDIQYDQVILEFNRWVHLSFAKENPRLQALIIDKKGTRPFENITS